MAGYAAVDYKLLGFKLSSRIVTVKSRGCGRCHDVIHIAFVVMMCMCVCINNTYSIFTTLFTGYGKNRVP